MRYNYDKDKIKNEISDEDMFEFLSELGAEPQWRNGAIINKTICHCGNSHKLYYYPNSKLFKCYTDCGDAWDIFELILKVKSHEYPEFQLPQAIDFVARYFGYSPETNFEEETSLKEDIEYIEKYDRIKNIKIETQEVELKEYDDTILSRLPCPHLPWEQEGISRDVILSHNIKYNPKTGGIIIPHYDINNRLIGIRERNLVEENIERYGKYHPAMIGNIMYNHPLSFSLYNLNCSQNNIKKFKKAIVFEGEKSPLKYISYFGKENDISVACTGSTLIKYQMNLLINAGAEEIIIGFDHDFIDIQSKEAKRLIKNLKNLHTKFGNLVTISFLWDKENRLGYKDSPIDKDKETFLELFYERINLYNK